MTVESLNALNERLHKAGVRSLGFTTMPGAAPAEALSSAVQLLNEYLDGKFTPVARVGDAPERLAAA